MEKDTLKGKVKILVYLVAFIIMIGLHKAIDKIGTGTPPVVSQKKGDCLEATGNIVKVTSLSLDSLLIEGYSR